MGKSINVNRHTDSYFKISYPEREHERVHDVEHGIMVSHNSDGYRSEEFEKDENQENILIAGCSVTYGEGLPYKYTWPNALKDLLPDKKIFNLSSTGRSFYTIIDDIYNYIDIYGKPRIVMILFPEKLRYQEYAFNKVKQRMISENDNSYYKIVKSYSIFEMDGPTKEVLKDDASLKVAKRIFSDTNLDNDFANRVYQLQKYLEAIGVPLIFSSWDVPTENFLWVSKRLSGFFPYTQKYKVPYVEKHYGDIDLLDNEMDKEIWLEAWDRPKPHPGILLQRSFANAFYSEAIERFGEKIFN